jgi:hypothetical protein
MYRYQIRIPDSRSLEGFIEKELTGRAWRLLSERLGCKQLSDQNYIQFEREMFRALIPHIKRFHLCGVSEICEELRPFVPAEAPHQNGTIFHLILNTPLETFLDCLTVRLLERLRLQSKENAFAAFKLVLRSVLGQYLYLNSWCGKAQLCGYSVPINPRRIQKKSGRVGSVDLSMF